MGIGVENTAAGGTGSQDLAADRAAQTAISFEAAFEAFDDIVCGIGEGVVDFGD